MKTKYKREFVKYEMRELTFISNKYFLTHFYIIYIINV